ncbi:uncharacterized protein LAESUDRAFT_810098 [Laetiporus sulphureus 93-53]|uniref:Uncharacterized protein n=1 Tax=Laetiporus sulphureus 93-53 TaxID=1314785 RepID=A0A165GK85_9APHY|nr:uncharacterized protein LAESUDRAFT_810098 [Laetiporus sulphureus 93-53]KZT10468.1 hypothetical protein LAESUDRAFT_810098 [Laetiporus sulphureus 93-53]
MPSPMQRSSANQPRTQRKRHSRMSLGFAMSLEWLRDYAKEHNMVRRSDVAALDEIRRKFGKEVLFVHWVKDDSPRGWLVFLAVATNTRPEYIAMATPERIAALKAALGRDDEPEWKPCFVL